jgi:NIPSNAP
MVNCIGQRNFLAMTLPARHATAPMTRRTTLFIALLLPLLSPATPSQAADTKCYELRTYTAAPGKLDALLQRFRNHTVALFAKHGMTNLGYWVPADNPDRKLIYLLSFPDRSARDASFKAFGSDPDWKAAQKASELDGKLVDKLESQFLTATDFSKTDAVAAGNPSRIYELRTYTCGTNHLPALLSRFRDHTVGLFSKHGMKHFGYWTPSAGQPGAEDTLIYLLIHESKDAMGASFAAFRNDPLWVAAKSASEKAAGGSLTVPDGVKSVLLIPTDFSPAK